MLSPTPWHTSLELLHTIEDLVILRLDHLVLAARFQQGKDDLEKAWHVWQARISLTETTRGWTRTYSPKWEADFGVFPGQDGVICAINAAIDGWARARALQGLARLYLDQYHKNHGLSMSGSAPFLSHAITDAVFVSTNAQKIFEYPHGSELLAGAQFFRQQPYWQYRRHWSCFDKHPLSLHEKIQLRTQFLEIFPQHEALLPQG